MNESMYCLFWNVAPGSYYFQKREYPRTTLTLLRWRRLYAPQEVRVYEPFREFSGLFRDFASTAPTQDGILAFADRFGRLGCDRAYNDEEFADPPRKSPLADFDGEPVDTWLENIRSMRRLVDLWDLCLAEDMTALAERIKWGGSFDALEVRYQREPGSEGAAARDPNVPAGGEMIASRLFHPERLSRFKPFDVFAPAVAYIEQSINRHLGAVPIQLVWNSARHRPGWRRGQVGADAG